VVKAPDARGHLHRDRRDRPGLLLIVVDPGRVKQAPAPMGLILSGAEGPQTAGAARHCRGPRWASYALSEREGRIGHCQYAHPRPRRGRRLDPQRGTKCWITNGGQVPPWYTVDGGDRPPTRAPNGISAFMVHKDDEGFSVGPQGTKDGDQGGHPPPSCIFENCHIPRGPDHRRTRHRP